MKTDKPFKGFWKRLEMFVSDVDANDPMSEEEKDMILNVCKEQSKQTEDVETFKLIGGHAKAITDLIKGQ